MCRSSGTCTNGCAHGCPREVTETEKLDPIAFSSQQCLVREEQGLPKVRVDVTVDSQPFGIKVAMDELPSIIGVASGSPAEAAGLQVGDIIIGINGETVTPAGWFDVYSRTPLPYTLTLDTCRLQPIVAKRWDAWASEAKLETKYVGSEALLAQSPSTFKTANGRFDEDIDASAARPDGGLGSSTVTSPAAPDLVDIGAPADAERSAASQLEDNASCEVPSPMGGDRVDEVCRAELASSGASVETLHKHPGPDSTGGTNCAAPIDVASPTVSSPASETLGNPPMLQWMNDMKNDESTGTAVIDVDDAADAEESRAPEIQMPKSDAQEEFRQAQDTRRRKGLDMRELQLSIAEKEVQELIKQLQQQDLQDDDISPQNDEHLVHLSEELARKIRWRDSLLHDLQMWKTWMTQSRSLAQEHIQAPRIQVQECI